MVNRFADNFAFFAFRSQEKNAKTFAKIEMQKFLFKKMRNFLEKARKKNPEE